MFQGKIALRFGMIHKSTIFRNVVITTTILLLTFNGCLTSPIWNKERVYCDFKDHLYYVPQINGCKKCDRCWDGEEAVMQGANVGMGLNGATRCPTCKVCSEGTYNPDGDIYWKCLTCTSCSDSGLHEVQPCSPKQNTKCSNKVQQVFESHVSAPPTPPRGRFQKITKGEDSHMLRYVALTGFLAGVLIIGIYQVRQICKENRIHEDANENVPSMAVVIEPDCRMHEQAIKTGLEKGDDSDDEDHSPGSIEDRSNTEEIPVMRYRKRCKSFGNYENTDYRFNKQVDKDKTDEFERWNPAFQRQLSLPVTHREIRNKELQLDKKRPNERCARFLSILLAPNEMYKAFARKMDLGKYKMKLLEEQLRHRFLTPEDVSHEYISRTLQNTRKLSYSDIFHTLTELGLHEEVQEMRKKAVQINHMNHDCLLNVKHQSNGNPFGFIQSRRNMFNLVCMEVEIRSIHHFQSTLSYQYSPLSVAWHIVLLHKREDNFQRVNVKNDKIY